MRLQKTEIQAIIDAFTKNFLPNDSIWLFGSRTDDSRRGGDIDLLIETHEPNIAKQFQQKMWFLVDVQQAIGEQKITHNLDAFYKDCPRACDTEILFLILRG